MLRSIMGTYRHENIPKCTGWWFPLIKSMWEFYEQNGCGLQCVCVTWDKNTQGSKAFGIFETAEAYFHTICAMPPSKRCGYEIVVADRPCKLYLDVEWETMGVDPAAFPTIQNICDAIAAKIRALPNRENDVLDFYRSTCSRSRRPKKDGGFDYKNSFHIVVCNVIFDNNHDGAMKEFVQQLGYSHLIDTTVYTKNRSMRTEMAIKMGDLTAFCSIGSSAIDPNTRTVAPEHMPGLVRSLIGQVDAELPRLSRTCLLQGAVPRNAESAVLTHSAQSTPRKRQHQLHSPAPPAGMEQGSGMKHHVCAGTGICVPADIVTAKDIGDNDDEWAVPAYAKKLLYQEGTAFSIDKVEINAIAMLPIVVLRLLESKRICLQDVRHIYIKHAKCCVTKLMAGITHSHHSNNSRAISVRLDGKTMMFTKCWGCDELVFSKINKIDGRLNILPSLRTNPAFHMILHSQYGLDRVVDASERIRVIALFQKNATSLAKLCVYNSTKCSEYTSTTAFLMDKYVQSAAKGWMLLAEPVLSDL